MLYWNVASQGEPRHVMTVTSMTDSNIVTTTKNWVEGMISRFGICPYTKSSSIAGVPAGGVRYTVSHALDVDQACEDYWIEVNYLLNTSPKDVATTLIIYPYCNQFNDVDSFETFSGDLDEAVEIAVLGDEIDNVYFHPKYKFLDKDGQQYIPFDEVTGEILVDTVDAVHPVSYARRSPWPLVNILRAPMVRASQKNMPEGRVFKNNMDKLQQVGSSELERMLQDQNWDGLRP